jgi:undecaprenyl-diphosphatase
MPRPLRSTRSIPGTEVAAVAVAELAIGGLLAALLAGLARNVTDDADLEVTSRVQGIKAPLLDAVMRAASWPGYPPESRVIPPLVISGWWLAGRRLDAAFQLSAWGTGLLSTALKWVVRRPRPVAPKVVVVRARLLGTSFPSGHVLTFVGFYGFLAYLVSRRVDPIALRAALVASLVALIALVGPSRVHQGHHWASDVAGSYLFGAAYLLALIELHRQLEARGLLAPERARLPRP